MVLYFLVHSNYLTGVNFMFSYELFKKRQKYKKEKISFIKNEIAFRLLNRVELLKCIPQSFLLHGFSQQSEKLMKLRCPDSLINKDLQNIDYIFSTCLMQSENRIFQYLSNCFCILNNPGFLSFTAFGPSTLNEVERAWIGIDQFKHVNVMIDIKDIISILSSLKFTNIVISSELLTFSYSNLSSLIKDIRDLNEPLSDINMKKFFTTREEWSRFAKKLSTDNLCATYEIIYGYCQKLSF